VKRKLIYATLREQLFDSLKELILTNQYQPGEELQVEKIAEEFGVSATPVREALVRLASIGLVEIVPNRGATVAQISADDVRWVWEARRVLELYAARITVECCTDAEIAMMEQKLAQVTKNPEDLTVYMEFDLELHQLLQRYLNNKIIRGMLDQVNEQSMRIRYFAESYSETVQKQVVEQVTAEHAAIVRALRQRSVEAVITVLEEHLRNGEIRTLKCLSNRGGAVKVANI
jgi:DNA-binding GntR family transcriptional regulator